MMRGRLKYERNKTPPRPEEARSAVSKDRQRPLWFETRRCATLLTMRREMGGCLKIESVTTNAHRGG
jgi:hypothetical protein